MKVKITKLAASSDPLYPTPSSKDYEVGKLNGNVSIPIDYYLEGEMMENLTVGKSVFVNRTSRNGVECAGIFQTSTVTQINGDCFSTQNSVYKIEFIE